MAWDWGLARVAVLIIGWPALVATGWWMMRQARQFRSVVGARPASSLVAASMTAWLVVSALLGLTATTLLFLAPQGTMIVVPVFIAWSGLLSWMLRVARGWQQEAIVVRQFYRDSERLDRLKATIINRFSHAFATPLTPMASELAVLRRYAGPLSDKQQRAVDRLARNQTRLAKMVDQAVLAGQVHGGQIPIARQEVDVHDVVVRASDAIEPLQIEVPRMAANIDAARIEDAIRMILEHGAARGDVHVTGRRTGDDVELQIRYRSTEDPQAVFGLFEDTEVTSADPLDLGLFTAQGIVALHGGDVVADRDGQDVVLSVRLPADVHQDATPALRTPTLASIA